MQVKALRHKVKRHKVKRHKVTLRHKVKYHKVKATRLLLDKRLLATLRLRSLTSLHRKAKP